MSPNRTRYIESIILRELGVSILNKPSSTLSPEEQPGCELQSIAELFWSLSEFFWRYLCCFLKLARTLNQSVQRSWCAQELLKKYTGVHWLGSPQASFCFEEGIRRSSYPKELQFMMNLSSFEPWRSLRDSVLTKIILKNLDGILAAPEPWSN